MIGLLAILFGLGCLFGALCLFIYQEVQRKRASVMHELTPIIEWRPTLRMDARAEAHIETADADDIPATWLLHSEEVRLVASAGGVPHVELRWRPSTRREVRTFVANYHRVMDEEIKGRLQAMHAGDLVPLERDQYDRLTQQAAE